jgi:hypothetical protein
LPDRLTARSASQAPTTATPLTLPPVTSPPATPATQPQPTVPPTTAPLTIVPQATAAPGSTPGAPAAQRFVVCALTTTLHDQPKPQAEGARVVATLDRGDVLLVDRSISGWVHGSAPSVGRSGWAPTQSVRQACS